MKKGEATGPQKQPRVKAVPASAPAPEPQADDERTLRTEDSRRKRAWDLAVSRLAEDASRLLQAVETLPAADLVTEADELPLEAILDAEKSLNRVRLELDQLASLA